MAISIIVFILVLIICYFLIRNPEDSSLGNTNPTRADKFLINKTPPRHESADLKPKYAPSTTPHDCYIAGIPHRLGKTVNLNKIFKVGQFIVAIREPKNQHDQNAIKLYANNNFVGYIPKDENTPYAKYMDSGGALKIIVTKIYADDPWKGVKISIERN